MGSVMGEDREDLGREILSAARDALYLRFPYLDTALCALTFEPGGGVTLSAATDGESLFYDGSWLSDRYLRAPVLVERAYLHMVLHCMFRHLAGKRGKVPELWDLACDIAVESVLDELPGLGQGPPPARRKVYGELRERMPVLTAEGIYRALLRRDLSEYERAVLQRQYLADDHVLWDPGRQDADRQDQRWKDLSERTKAGMETVRAGQATGGDAVLEQVRAAVRDDVDYRAFLRRFAAPREALVLDPDAFDLAAYTYGLRLYGNVPLVEPLETREEPRVEGLVIAVDTSMSTSGELVRLFLACTYAILRTTGSFTRRPDIHIIQCDDQVRSDTTIRDLGELKDLMERFELRGGSATDFRPVFRYVEERRREGAFRSLRGLIYLTDGMGIWPWERPPYRTAFVMMEEPPIAADMPPWAVRLILPLKDLERAAREASEDAPDLTDLSDLMDLTDLDELPEL